jgi:hypothetical protein
MRSRYVCRDAEGTKDGHDGRERASPLRNRLCCREERSWFINTQWNLRTDREGAGFIRPID